MFKSLKKHMTVATAAMSMLVSVAPSSVLGSTLPVKAMRDVGQSEFVTLTQSYFDRLGGGMNRSMDTLATSEAPEAGEAREVEESDVFKIRPGSKELYLLNRYRGLQVVSFDQGAEFPELLGRTDATGNWSTEMYSDWANDRLVAIENFYDKETRRYTGHLVLYSIADKKNPEIGKDIKLNGEIVDSRKVGDVLYVVTRVRKTDGAEGWWSRNANNDEDYEAVVYSFNMDENFNKAGEHKIAGKLAYSNRILNTVRDGNNYYLMAGMYGGETQGNWWSRNTRIAVLDISDADGKIKSEMKVELRGQVREKSQLFVKDGYFVAASNYQSEFTNQLRVSVEAFKLPGATPKLMSQVEVDFIKYQTKLAVAAEKARLEALGNMPSNKIAEAQAQYETALAKGTQTYKTAFGELNLAQEGMMVMGDDGFLSPVMASSKVDTGDTQGQDAQIQDVRLHNDLLYVFWVPRNMIDPLDVFDVSDLNKGVEYKNRLMFEGWMERSFPFTFNNKKYLIALGYKQPATGTGANFRFLQAGLFEIKQSQSGAVRAQMLSNFDLESADVRSNLNDQDKFMEFKFDPATGKGAVLLSAYQYRPNYQSGGKVIYFDVNEAEFNFDEVFTEGEMLVAESSWLRRVFSNPEIDKIHTFSNKNLTTFEGQFSPSALDRSQDTSKALSVLELARNIREYVSFEQFGKKFGVQVIQNGNYWNRENLPSVELRMVDAATPDAEKTALLGEHKVDGYLKQSYFDMASSSFYLVLQERVQSGTERWNYSYKSRLVKLALDAQNGIVETEVSLPEDNSLNSLNRGSTFFPMSGGEILFINNGTAYALTSAGVDLMTADAACFPNTNLMGSSSRTIKEFNGQFFFTEKSVKNSKKYRNVQEERNYLTPVMIDFAAKSLLCGTRINVPGEVVMLDGDKLLTKDQLLVDMLVGKIDLANDVADIPSATLTNQGILVASVLSAGKAEISDVERFDASSISSAKQYSSDSVVFFESTEDEGRFDFGGPIFRPGVGMPGFIMPRRHRPSKKHFARFFSVNAANEIEFTTRQFNADLESVSLSELFEMNGKKMALVRHGRDYQVFEFNADDRPEAMKVKMVSGNGTVAAESSSTFNLPSYWHQNFNGTPALDSIEFSMGDYGVKQVKIEF